MQEKMEYIDAKKNLRDYLKSKGYRYKKVCIEKEPRLIWTYRFYIDEKMRVDINEFFKLLNIGRYECE